ncbi:MAG TPA: DUF3307 domain-containing protein [Hyphomicrobiaceae bacterium]
MSSTLAPLWQMAGLLVVHWIGDFVLQSSWMAENKSDRLDALIAHVITYSITLAVGAGVIFGIARPGALVSFVIANALLHMAVDFTTSRIAARFWRSGQWRAFFIVVGADQLLHQICLALTLSMLIKQT